MGEIKHHCDFPVCENKIHRNILFKISKKRRRFVKLCFEHFLQCYKEDTVGSGETRGLKFLKKITLPVKGVNKEFDVIKVWVYKGVIPYNVKSFYGGERRKNKKKRVKK